MQTSLNATPAEHLAQARDLLNDVWDRAEAGPYPLFHAYTFGLANAKAHLDALGTEYPNIPPYDESLYEPTRDVDIDPEDWDHPLWMNELGRLLNSSFPRKRESSRPNWMPAFAGITLLDVELCFELVSE